MDLEKSLDDVDWKLLRELQMNARSTYTELGRRLALTPPAVAERVRRLEEAGVITGYAAQLNLAKVGLPITAFVRVRGRAEYTCAQIATLAMRLPEVLESHRVTGEDSCVLKVAVRSVEHLEQLIDRLVSYGETTTSIVLSSPVTHRVFEQLGEEASLPSALRP